MGLNNESNLINKISKMSDEQLENIDLEVFLVSKALETDDLYNAKKESLDLELLKWIKKSVRNELKDLKIENESNEKVFYVDAYNFELTKNDFIAKLNLDEDEDLAKKVEMMKNSLLHEMDINDLDVKIQVIKIEHENEKVYLVYYRGIKASAMSKSNVRRIPTIRHRNQLVIQENDVVEFGGKMELMMIDNFLYIISPRTLEYSFDYRDHISIRKEKNLEAITNMSFFDKDSNIEFFKEKSNQYMISRKLAGISQETLLALETSFIERCSELRKIKENIPELESEKVEYKKKYEVIWPLYSHIDLFEKKIRINENKSIEPLIHFFTDRIVESFLTKELRESF